MNVIACLVKKPTEPAKFAVIDTDDLDAVAEIIGASNLDLNVFGDVCGVISDANPALRFSVYNCSIRGHHFYGNIIIAGITGNNLHDIVLTPGFIEKYIPSEDRY